VVHCRTVIPECYCTACWRAAAATERVDGFATYSLDQAASKLQVLVGRQALGIRLNQLELERGGANVEHENIHSLLLSLDRRCPARGRSRWQCMPDAQPPVPRTECLLPPTDDPSFGPGARSACRTDEASRRVCAVQRSRSTRAHLPTGRRAG